MIGFIKNIFSGILSFFIGLFGGNKSQKNKPSLEADKSAANPATKKRKSNGYFMELDETEEMQPGTGNGKQANEASEPVAAVTKVAQKTKELVAATTKVVQKTEEPASVANAKAETTKTAEPATVAKSNKAEEPASATQPPKVQLEQTAEGVKAVPAKPAASSTINKPQTETTFAPKYLNPSTSSNGRRRPGPNMNSFLDMARQVKNPG